MKPTKKDGSSLPLQPRVGPTAGFLREDVVSPGSGLGREAHVQEVGPVWVLTGPSNHTVLVGRGTLHQRLALQGLGWEERKHRPVVSLGCGLRQPLGGGSLGAWGWAGASSPSFCSGGAPGQSGAGLGQPWGAGPGAELGTSSAPPALEVLLVP